MESSKIKQNKGKRKISKLKTILASPTKIKYPSLDDGEIRQLKELLLSALNNSSQSKREFINSKHIRLGLECCLRAINKGPNGIVLISHSIRPRFLSGLIARNAEVKDETVPVYIQPELENFTKEIFDIPALALILPNNIDKTLDEWLSTCRKFKESKKYVPAKKQIPKIFGDNLKSQVNEKQTNVFKTNEPKIDKSKNDATNFSEKPNSKIWSDDYISIENINEHTELGQINLNKDKYFLSNAFGKIAGNVQNIQTPEGKSSEIVNNTTKICNTKIKSGKDVSGFDFLNTYNPLVIHKIIANRNRVNKKKIRKTKKS